MPTPAKTALIHVALVEDDVHFRNAFIPAIEAAAEMRLASVCCTRAEGMHMLDSLPADVLVVDLGLPDGSGIDVIRAATIRWPECSVMVSTIFGDEAHVIQSIEAGASGYLLKDGASYNMMDDIRNLNSGGSPVSPLIARQILTRFRQGGSLRAVAHPAVAQIPGAGTSSLSARERQVLELITKGFTYDEVAGLMQVTRSTVTTFVRRIYSKLKVRSKTEAVYEARNRGLITE